MTRARGRDADMTQGNILRQYIDFALPLTVGLLFQQLYSAVDSIVVGNFVGETALGAVGSTGNIINMLIGVCNGLSLGAGAVISQAYGAKNHERISKAVHTTMLMTFLLCIVATAVGVAIVKPSLQLMRTPDSMLAEATEYLTIYFAGIAGLLIYNMGSAILRAVGDSRRPLYFLMAAGVMNVLGDLLFVCVLGMGVAGVALATVLSQCVSATLTVLCLTGSDGMCHLDMRRLRFYPERFAQIMKIGLPAGMQSVIFNISNVLIQSSINSFGAVAVAGNTAAANVEGFVYISMNSLYQTTLSFTSQNLGAKQYRRVDGILVRCMILVILIGVVLGQGAYRLGDPLLHIYSQDPEVIAYGIQRFSVVSVTYFLCGMMDVGSGVVRGLGYSIMPMLVSMVGACVFRVIWIFTVFRMYHTLFTLYVSYPISWVLTVIAHLVCYLVVRRKIFPKKQ